MPGRIRTAYARRPGVRSLLRNTAIGTLFALGTVAGPALGQSLPSGGTVSLGDAVISSSGSGLLITQSSRNAVIGWNTFSIGTGNVVHFENASGATLNRVTGALPSSIDGALTATGSVYLVNPAGVTVGTGGMVRTGGSFVASTLDMTDADFLAGGDIVLSGTSMAGVSNHGAIVSLGGDVVLAARRVENTGSISAQQGDVGLLAGYEVLLRDLAHEEGRFAVRVGGADTELVNTGSIEAVNAELRAQGGNVYALAGNTDAVIKATGVAAQGGRVFLTAGAGSVQVTQRVVARPAPKPTKAAPVPQQRPFHLGGSVRVAADRVTFGGEIDVSGDGAPGGTIIALARETLTLTERARLDASGSEGGFVETSGAHVSIAHGARVTTLGSAGPTGTWLIDPTDFTIGAGDGPQTGSGIGAATLSDNLQTTSVHLQTLAAGAEPGDIHVNAAVAWSAGTVLTLSAHNDININADITATGDGAGLVLDHGVGATYTLDNGAKVTLSGANPSLSIGGNAYAIIQTLDQLQAIQTSGLSGRYALGTDIDAALTASWNDGAGFVPIGTFTGTFAGLGHTVSGLTINRPDGGSPQGLFGTAFNATIRDINLTGVSITGRTDVGGLVGLEEGGTTILRAFVSGTVFAETAVGGLVGRHSGAGSLIDRSSTFVTLTGTSQFHGGLVGWQAGSNNRILGSSASGAVNGGSTVGGLVGWQAGSGNTIEGSSASGHVTGGGNVGGLVGHQQGVTISDSWATGNVTVSGIRAGGLVGFQQGATISDSWAAGNVTAGERVGGLVGDLEQGSTVVRSWATGDVVAGTNYAGGLAGVLYANSVIEDSRASGNVTAAQQWAGGLVGWMGANSEITGSHAEGNVTGGILNGNGVLIGGRYIGGLVGEAWAGGAANTIASSYATGAVTTGHINGASYAGGLVGDLALGNVSNSHATGSVSGSGNFVGGLVGRQDRGDISGSHASGAVSGITYVGGLVGSQWESGYLIEDSHASGAVTGTTQIGGLVGDQNGAITRSYATGTVAGTGSFVGGLVGSQGGAITQSYATGAVRGTGYVGGLVGQQDANIVQSHASGAVVGTTYVGGLVGLQAGWGITQSYATGAVSGTGAVGGLVGEWDSGTVTASYWSTETTGQSASAGGTGLTTEQLQAALPVGFDDTVWGIVPGVSYPYHLWRFPSGPTVVSGTVSGISGGNGGVGIGAAVEGTAGSFNLANTHTGANGYYHMMLDPAAAGAAALVFLDGTRWAGAAVAERANILRDVTGGHLTGLAISGSGTIAYAGAKTSVTSLFAPFADASWSGLLFSYDTEDGLTLASGSDLSLTLPGAFTVDAALAATGAGRVTISAADDLTLAAAVSSQAGGDAVRLAAGGIFENQAGADAISTPNGRWLVYLGDPDGHGYGGLDSTNTAVWNTAALAEIPASGNRYVFAAQSVLNFVAIDRSKIYGDALAFGSVPGVDYEISGLHAGIAGAFLGDDAASAFSGSPVLASLGAVDTASVVAGGYAITIDTSGLTALNGYQIGAFTPGTLTVDRRTLNVTVLGGNKVYDGTTAATVSFVDDRIFADDAVSVGHASASFADRNAGTAKTVTVTGLSLVGADAGNYVLAATSATTQADISRALLTISATADSRVYDGTTGSAAGPAVTFGQVFAGDALTGLVQAFDSRNAGTRTLSVTGYALEDGNGGDNYAVTLATTTGTITPAALTISAVADNRVYDGTTASAGAPSFDPAQLFGGDTLTNLVQGFDSRNAGARTLSVLAGYTLEDGNGGANYALAFETVTGTITPAALTISAVADSRVYDGTTASAGAPSFDPAQLFGGDTLTNLVQGFDSRNAGARTLSVLAGYTLEDGNGGANYTVALATAAGTITPAALTITAGSTTKTYGDLLTFAGTEFTTSGLVNAETVGSVMLTSAGAAADADLSGSPYAIVASGAAGGNGFDAANYAIAYIEGVLTVTPRALTITANSTTKTYGDLLTFAGTEFTASGLVLGQTIGSVTLMSLGAAADASVTGSPYAIVASAAGGGNGFDAGNYAISYINGALTVTPRALTITANSTTKTYGDLLTFAGTEFTASGLVLGQTVGSVTLTSAGAAAQADVAGSPYAIAASAAAGGTFEASNYAIAYLDGALTVTPRSITLSAENKDRLYGDANPELTFGAVGGDGLAAHHASLAAAGFGLTTAANSTSSVAGGPYAITLTGANANYAITAFSQGLLSVNRRSITITANAATKTYGDLLGFAGTEFQVVNLANDETVGSVTLTSAGAAADAAVSGSPYAIVASGAAGGTFDASNYAITYLEGALTVTRRALTITANSTSKTYGDLLGFAGTEFTASGLALGQTVGSVTLTSAGAAAEADVAGSPYAVVASGAAGGTFDASNYAITYLDGALTVTRRALVFSAENAHRLYGDLNPALTFGSAIGGDGLAAHHASLAAAGFGLTTAAVSTSDVGGYAIVLGDVNANYDVTGFTAGTLSVNQRAIVLSAENKSRFYGETNPALTFGAIGGDGLAAHHASPAAAGFGLATAAGPGSGVAGGPYAITLTGGNANYAVTAFTPGLMSVIPRPITVTAEDKSKIIDDPDPPLTFLIGGMGLVFGDTLAGALAREPGEASGGYAILLGTLSASANYALDFTQGLFTILDAPGGPGGPVAPVGDLRGWSIERPAGLGAFASPLPTLEVGGEEAQEDCSEGVLGADCADQVHPDNRDAVRFVGFSR